MKQSFSSGTHCSPNAAVSSFLRMPGNGVLSNSAFAKANRAHVEKVPIMKCISFHCKTGSLISNRCPCAWRNLRAVNNKGETLPTNRPPLICNLLIARRKRPKTFHLDFSSALVAPPVPISITLTKSEGLQPTTLAVPKILSGRILCMRPIHGRHVASTQSPPC